MTVDELIGLLRQCSPLAKVVWEHDGMAVHPTGIERCSDGTVEFLAYDMAYMQTLRELGHDILTVNCQSDGQD